MGAVRKTERSKSDEADRLRDLRRQLGRILKSWREESGLTQADLAQKLDLKYYSFISQVENGLGRMPQDLYGPWADAVGVPRETFSWCILAHMEPSLYAELSRFDAKGSAAWGA